LEVLRCDDDWAPVTVRAVDVLWLRIIDIYVGRDLVHFFVVLLDADPQLHRVGLRDKHGDPVLLLDRLEQAIEVVGIDDEVDRLRALEGSEVLLGHGEVHQDLAILVHGPHGQPLLRDLEGGEFEKVSHHF
jgi:hypothetical protein